MTSSPEKMDITRFSALSRVCEQFAKSCQENQIEVSEAYLAIGRFLGISAPTSQVNTAADAKSTRVDLTKAQLNQAKKEAKAEKAKRLGLTVSEVNLTSQEVKAAKDAFRSKLSLGGEAVAQAAVLPAKDKGSASSGSKKKQKEKAPAPEGVGAADPERQKLKNRIDTVRRNLLRTAPWLIESPTLLSLVAYQNGRVRLSKLWFQLSSNYDLKGAKNPLRGLPDLDTQPYSAQILNEARSNYLIKDPSDPDLYTLQTPDGDSFWDGDRPSEACPLPLKYLIPKDELRKLEEFVALATTSP
jgi:hypothetical protein